MGVTQHPNRHIWCRCDGEERVNVRFRLQSPSFFYSSSVCAPHTRHSLQSVLYRPSEMCTIFLGAHSDTYNVTHKRVLMCNYNHIPLSLRYNSWHWVEHTLDAELSSLFHFELPRKGTDWLLSFGGSDWETILIREPYGDINVAAFPQQLNTILCARTGLGCPNGKLDDGRRVFMRAFTLVILATSFLLRLFFIRKR